MTLQPIHRFPTHNLKVGNQHQWDLPKLWAEMLTGMKMAADMGCQPISIGCDTWGVDYGLLDAAGNLLEGRNPVCYRDERTAAPFAELQAPGGGGRGPEIFRRTGTASMVFNTLYQLAAEARTEPHRLAATSRLLFMPDLLHHMLCGSMVSELSIASTSQLLAAGTWDWDRDLAASLGIPPDILPPLVNPGTVLGTLLPEVAAQTGLPQSTRIVTPAGHDTGSAVVAVPFTSEEIGCGVYISSGTWSLMGTESAVPIINEATRAGGYTNEIGHSRRYRLQKNIMGLWLVQEVRRDLESKGTIVDYPALTRQAAAAPPLRSLVNPDDATFFTPGDMLGKITRFCQTTDQPVPTTPGEFVRACLESLALAYRQTLLGLEEIVGRELGAIYVVGGGCRNELLNQMTADACGRIVLAGPAEATALGNAIAQAIAAGELSGLGAARAVSRASEESKVFTPTDAAVWRSAYSRYLKLV